MLRRIVIGKKVKVNDILSQAKQIKPPMMNDFDIPFKTTTLNLIPKTDSKSNNSIY
jgi:hypothetical protein